MSRPLPAPAVPSDRRRTILRPGALAAARLRAFGNDTRGSVAIEAVMLLPLLFWAYLAMFSFFDMLRQQSLNQKASYTIADMFSRETQFINDTYVTNAHALLKSMVRSDGSTALRVTVLAWDDGAQRFDVKWSEARGPGSAMPLGSASAGMKDKLPLVPPGEHVILVETWTDYQIPFKIGMEDFNMNTFTFTAPRFASQLCFSNDPAAVECVNA